jgi:hypothetical protein
MKRTILFSFGILFAISAWSQNAEERLQQLWQDYPEPMQTLVSADAAVQEAALEAATQGQALSQLQKIQDRSRAAFGAIVEPYSQETQQIFWDLARYPNLIERLARAGSGGAQAVLRDYPTAIHARAQEASRYYHNLLIKIADLQQQTEADFNNLLQTYPRRTQDVFRRLIDQPEVLSALTQNRRVTEELASLYRQNPNWTLRRFQELNRELAQQNESQLQDWRSELETDPEAAREFTESAQSYAREYGYDDEYYDYDRDYDDRDYYDPNRRRVVIRQYHYYPYPYWFGYPRWYRQARWRPVPLWYDYGFRYRPNRPIVIVQMPSFHFVNWYFYRPYNHFRFARLSNCFVNYYYRNPRSYNNIVINVNVWKTRNRDLVADNWLAERNNRVERLREFGRLEQERVVYNQNNRSREITQRDYLEKNATQYPKMREVAPARTAVRETTPERSVETPRPNDTAPQPRTRAEAHARNGQTPERTENVPAETPRRAIPQPEQSRRREAVQPRETPNATEPEYTPRRSTQAEQLRRREAVQPRETPNQPEPQRRAPIRREEPRSPERQPNREVPSRAPQERTREQARERSEQPTRSVERPRNNDSKARGKAAPRSRSGEE